MDLNYFPFIEPSFKDKIILPSSDKIYIKEYYNKKYYVESGEIPEINIDIKKLREGRISEEEGYNIGELKEFAKILNVENFSKLNKKELVNIIKIKLKV